MNETLKTIHDLHSTHGEFSKKQISDEDLQSILMASVRAANAGNAQNYAIIVSQDPNLMKEVCGFQAPVMLVYCVDTQRNKDLAQHLGLAYTADPAWMLLTGTTDAALAAQTAVVAARSLGIDSLISNGVQRGEVRRFWKLLDLPPRNVLPVLAVYLGYADKQTDAHAGRLTEPGVIHRGKYRNRSKELLEAIIKVTDAPGFFPGWDWRKEGNKHYLEAYFKGPGGRASTMYGGIVPALAAAGINVSAVEESHDA